MARRSPLPGEIQYSPEMGEAICLRLAGGESLNRICRDDDMPHRASVHRWLLRDHEFRRSYEFARQVQADYYAEQVIELADEADASTSPAVHKAKLQVDARKWAAARMAPRKWGDRSQVDLGATGSSEVVVRWASDVTGIDRPTGEDG